MEEKCSIGTILNLNCTICENRKNLKIDVDDLPLLEYKSLKIRSKIKDFNTVENACKYHKTQFAPEFSNYYRRCADPVRSHNNVVKTSLHEIEFRLYCIPCEILPGEKLCFCCKNKVFVEKRDNENVGIEHENENEVMETDEILHETANDIINQSLEMLECSPLKVLQSDRTL